MPDPVDQAPPILAGMTPSATDAPMTAAEFRTMREQLGFSRAEMARFHNVSSQTIENWERVKGKNNYPVPAGVTVAMMLLWDQQTSTVGELTRQLKDSTKATLTLPIGNPTMPDGYWRSIAWLVMQTVPGVRVTYAGD